jgi:hypothetical protein
MMPPQKWDAQVRYSLDILPEQENFPDRYRHTYQLGIDVNIGGDDRILESGENMDRIVLGRKEAAHITLKILSNLKIPWMRGPKKLLGWEETI